MTVLMRAFREIGSPRVATCEVVRSSEPESEIAAAAESSSVTEEEEEEKVYVAVGKEVEKEQSKIVWTLRNFGRKQICVLHVHQPDLMISVLGGNFPISSLDEQEIKAHREKEKRGVQKVMDQYLAICLKAGLRAEPILMEMGSVEKGILELITTHKITTLVMGGAADKHYSKYKPHNKKMADLKSKKATVVRNKAPESCQIWFICKGCLIFRRECSLNAEVASLLLAPSPSTEVGGLNLELRTRSVGLPPPALVPTSKTIFDSPGLRRWKSAAYVEQQMKGRSSSADNSLSSSPDVYDQDNIQLSPPDQAGITEGTLYDQLKQAMEDVARLKKQAFEEAVRCEKAEQEAIEAIRQAQTFEDLYLKEQTLRKETEEALKKEKEVLASRCENAEKEAIKALHKAQTSKDECLKEKKLRRESEKALAKKDEELARSEHAIAELESKIISAVELLKVYKHQRDKLETERDSLLQEVEELWINLAKATSNAPPVDHQFIEFSVSEIRKATDNFDSSLEIGEGGYGKVYKACLHHTDVAIKVLLPNSSQGTPEFLQEVKVLSKVRHPNLVTLIGSCSEARALIYEYLPNGSLEDQLSCQNSTPISWQTRIRIATELCSSLIFLHSCQPHSIVHGDLKPANILLDTNFITKLSDFGMCRLLPCNASNNRTLIWMTDNPRGTPMYIDPHYLQTGELTPKSDVYSFGVILLRLLTGRQAFRIIKEMQSALNTGRLSSLLDSSAGDWPLVETEQLAHLALRCCELNRKSRPDLETEMWRVLGPMRAFSSGLESNSSNY